MLGQDQFKELRGSKRHRLPSEPYAIIRQQNYSEVAQLLDISRGGVSFLCINEGDWRNEPFFIDLASLEPTGGDSPEHLALKNIPLQPLAYWTCNYERLNPTSIMQKCGVSFGELTPEQATNLNNFILKFSAGSA
jgi:hypothetical protein